MQSGSHQTKADKGSIQRRRNTGSFCCIISYQFKDNNLQPERLRLKILDMFELNGWTDK